MKVKTAEIGGVCVSIQGRDSGTLYVILGVAGGYVTVADGLKHGVSNPKKKNLKHLRLLPARVSEAAQAAEAGKPVYDHQISYALRTLCTEANKSEDHECQKTT